MPPAPEKAFVEHVKTGVFHIENGAKNDFLCKVLVGS